MLPRHCICEEFNAKNANKNNFTKKLITLKHGPCLILPSVLFVTMYGIFRFFIWNTLFTSKIVDGTHIVLCACNWVNICHSFHLIEVNENTNSVQVSTKWPFRIRNLLFGWENTNSTWRSCDSKYVTIMRHYQIKERNSMWDERPSLLLQVFEEDVKYLNLIMTVIRITMRL